jgi:phosphoglycolate phosphatase
MKGWIFDLDGTLVDSLPGIAHALNAALRDHRFPEHPENMVRTFIGDGVETLVSRALGSAHTAHISAVVSTFRIHYAESWKTGTIPYPMVLETLAALQASGAKTAILSNKPHRFTAEIAAVLFGEWIDIALGEGEDVPHKPDPAGIHKILQQWNLPKDQVCMVGDSVMDLQAATAAGIPSIAVTWGYHDAERLRAENPETIIDCISDLMNHLQG